MEGECIMLGCGLGSLNLRKHQLACLMLVNGICSQHVTEIMQANLTVLINQLLQSVL